MLLCCQYSHFYFLQYCESKEYLYLTFLTAQWTITKCISIFLLFYLYFV
jgi:hypothetical protein